MDLITTLLPVRLSNICNEFIQCNNGFLGIATALKQAQSPDFVEYQQQIVKNAQKLAEELQKNGYTCVTGGTDNHLVWVDLRSVGLNGSRAEKVLEEISIACNKNTVPGDKSAFNPGGIRLGTPALTTRGLKEVDIVQVVQFIHQGTKLEALCFISHFLFFAQQACN